MASSITFPGTSNHDLVVLDNPAFNDGKGIRDMDELIRQTSLFRQNYSPPPVPWGHRQAHREGTWNEKALLPRVVVIRGSEDSFDTPTLSTNKGLIGSVLTAYSTHQNLQLRPDDIWITLLAQFSSYVNGRAEELRDKIVDHEGQKELEVKAGGTIYSVDFGWMSVQMLDKISENIKDPTLREWFLPGFSTSTIVDDVSAAAMAMCSFQAYFTYKFSLLCGIPQITLLGTVEDWTALRQKVERFVEFDDAEKTMSTKWVPLLRSIVDNFVESSQNGSKNNMDFWDSIVSHKRVPAGCADRNDLTGWISTFTIFNERGELYANMEPEEGHWPQVQLDDIYHNIATCPVKIDDNGVKYNSTMYVGQMAYDFVIDEASTDLPPTVVESISTQDGKMRLVKPRNDWGLVISQGFDEVSYVDPDDIETLSDGTVMRGNDCPVSKLYDPFRVASDEQKHQRLA